MTTNVLFISETALKTNTIVNANIDNKLITPSIIDCQNIYILSVIGSGLFNEIATQITTSGLSANNIYLLEQYIQPALKNYVIARLIPDITYQMRNGTVSELQGDTFQTNDFKKMEYNINRYQNIGEWYASQLSKYLCANSATYPLYTNPGDTGDTIRPNHNSFRSSIFIPKN